FGTADPNTNQPMATNLYMRIGSLTKTFTVTAVLQLVDKGDVGLDDPIAKYLPTVPGGDRVTVRDLADMRSGLPSYSKNDAWLDTWLANPTAPWTPQQLVAYSYEEKPLFDPGTSFEYSNTNTVLLGLLVEQVSHQPLDRYIQKHIVEPLHLTRTSFPTTAAFPSPHAQGYTNQTPTGALTTATDWDPSWGWAAGAMISNVQDMGIWAKALATGSLLSKQTQAARLTFPELTKKAGYGVGITTVNGWLGHTGSIPGYQTLVVYEPETQTSMVVLVNADIPPNGATPRDVIGEAISRVIAPNHVFTKEPQD
ncbi:MAG: serine hydrolase domain-containing protein, partial [Candidatus Dormibacteria bacterium]